MRPVSLQNSPRVEDPRLGRIVWALLAAVAFVAVAFGAYYYWDRYVALGDKSPVEKNIQHLEEQVRKNPEDPNTRLALAQYYLESGMAARSLEQAQQVLNAYPEKHEALFMTGVAYLRAGQPQAAIEPLEKLVSFRRGAQMAKADSILEAALYYLGDSYIRVDDPAKAIPVLTEALTIDRTDADALYRLGVAYALEGQHEQALEQLQRAVLFVPDLAEAYDQMAKSYAALSRPDYVTYAQGMEAYSRKDYTNARTLLARAVAKAPDLVAAQLGLGLTLEQTGELQLAKKSFQKVLAAQPDNMLASRGLSRIDSPGGAH